MKRSGVWLGRLGFFLLALGWFSPVSSHAALPSGAWVGVVVHTVESDVLDDLGLDFGVRIGIVIPGSPADEAGLKKGDVVVRVNDRPVYSPKRLAWLMRQYEIYRNGERKSVTLRLGKRPRYRLGFEKRAYLGVKLQELNPALRKFFGAPEDRGVLIAEVRENSPATKAGLHVGDVILKMDRKSIRSVRDVYRVLDFFEPGDQITVEILRDKKKQKMSVTLGEHQDAAWQLEGGKRWGQIFIPELEDDLGWSLEEFEALKERLMELREYLREWAPEIRKRFQTMQEWGLSGSI